MTTQLSQTLAKIKKDKKKIEKRIAKNKDKKIDTEDESLKKYFLKLSFEKTNAWLNAYRKYDDMKIKKNNIVQSILKATDKFKDASENVFDIKTKDPSLIITKEDIDGENEKVLNFMNDILLTNKNNIMDILIKFSNDTDNVKNIILNKRLNVLYNLTNYFSIKLLKKFATAYLSQDETEKKKILDLNKFYKKFVKLDENKKIINNNKILELENQLFQKKQQYVPIPVDRIDPITKEIIIIEEKPQSKDTYLNTKSQTIYDQCYVNHVNASWLPFRVFKRYIAFIDDNISNKNIFINEDPVEIDGINWYRTNQDFIKLLCNTTYIDKESLDDVMIINDLKIKIGFKTDKSDKLTKENLTVQTDEMFNDEKTFFNRERLSKIDKMKNMLSMPPTDNVINVCRSTIVDKFLKVSNYNQTYTYNSEFMDQLMQTLVKLSLSNEELINRVAKILVYVNIDNNRTYDIEVPNDYTFIKRLESNMYMPTIIPLLEKADFMPNIYGRNSKILEQLMDEKFVILFDQLKDNMIDNVLKLSGNIQIKGSINHIQYNLNDDDIIDDTNYIKSNKSVCANDTVNIPDENLIYYDENDKKYCFNIVKLIEQFKQSDFVNKYTKQKFKKEFINNFLKTYNIDVLYYVEDGVKYLLNFDDIKEQFNNKDYVNKQNNKRFSDAWIHEFCLNNGIEYEKNVVDDDIDLTPGLLQMIFDDLGIEDANEEVEEVKEEVKEDVISTSVLNNIFENVVDSDDEDEDVDIISSSTVGDIKVGGDVGDVGDDITSSSTVGDVKVGNVGAVDSDDGKCANCSTVTNLSYSSFEESKPVHFCSADCMGKHDFNE